MKRHKIDYGIDLGTTNSAICRIEAGQPVIKKSDMQADTMPSCVSFTRKRIVKVGQLALNELRSDKIRAIRSRVDSNTFIEFKRAMGSDATFHSSHMERDFTPEELSAQVLRSLRGFVSDESVDGIVITVPAKFTINQKEATIRAARQAGFSQCELIQEPIAAAWAYGANTRSDSGLWMVFDFGGGTFDVALIKVEDGVCRMLDTQGDNFLGGKNIDEAIVNGVIIPYLKENFVLETLLADTQRAAAFREALKVYVEEAKVQLSFKQSHWLTSTLGDLGCDDQGVEIELDLNITADQIAQVIAPVYQRAIDICNDMLAKKGIAREKIDALILIGGPTLSPVLRKMLAEQITPRIDTSIDPMTAVARGAALYASTLDLKTDMAGEGTVELDVVYNATTIETEAYVTLKCKNAASERFSARLVNSTTQWSSDTVDIGGLGDVIAVPLSEGSVNILGIELTDAEGRLRKAHPNQITIRQGIGGPKATLPYNIGIEVYNSASKKHTFEALQGLEKNRELPATGKIYGLKTPDQLRPGNESDRMVVPIFQGEDNASGKSSLLSEHITDIVVTGENIPSYLPAGSVIDITLRIDTSERITLDVYFAEIDHTESGEGVLQNVARKTPTYEEVDNSISRSTDQLTELAAQGYNTDSLAVKLRRQKDELDSGSEKQQCAEQIKHINREIVEMQNDNEWHLLATRIEELYNNIALLIEGSDQLLAKQQFARQKLFKDAILAKKSVKEAHKFCEQLEITLFILTKTEQERNSIQYWDEHFDEMSWKDREQARILINKAKNALLEDPTGNIVDSLYFEIGSLIVGSGNQNTDLPVQTPVK